MMVGRAVERRGLLSGDGFLASFCGAQFCCELLEGGFSIGFRSQKGNRLDHTFTLT